VIVTYIVLAWEISMIKLIKVRFAYSGIILLYCIFLMAFVISCDSLESPTKPIPSPTPIATKATIINYSPTIINPTIVPTSTAINKLSTPTMPKDWKTRWLIGIPCRPPCYEGITPGVTTNNEALQKLLQNPIVADAKMKVYNSPRDSEIDWSWLDQGGTGGRLFFDASSPQQTINLINPYIPGYFKYNEIVPMYGEPTHVIAFVRLPDGNNNSLIYEMRLIWLNYGFWQSVKDPGKPTLRNSILLESPNFFAPSINGFEKASFGTFHSEYFVAWQGFKDFEFYCRNPQGNGQEDCSKIINTFKP